jgi:hypothetical protein
VVDIDRSALTTIPCRSCSGPGLAHFASTLLVCAGLVLLLPEPVSSERDGLSEAGTSVCAASHDTSQDHQWTDGVAVNPPDSCDDEDDDDDGDDDSSGGSGQAIGASHHIPHLDAALHGLHADIDRHMFRPLDAHSLRGPPSIRQESTDADVDDDDDDDDSLGGHHSGPLAAANSREPQLFSIVQFFRVPSIGSGNALRAPPESFQSYSLVVPRPALRSL